MFRYIVCVLLIGQCGLLVESAGDPGAELCLGCPDYWIKLGEVCYRYFGSPTTWDDANSVCQQMGSNLPSIHSLAESESIYQLWKTLVHDSTLEREGFWCGLHDRYEEGTYMWTDGSPFDYAVWYPGQPDNAKGSDPAGENCVTVWNRGTNDLDRQEWNDYPCGGYHFRPFFCRKSL